MAMMCKGCGKAAVYKGSMCKGCHAMPAPDLMKKGDSDKPRCHDCQVPLASGEGHTVTSAHRRGDYLCTSCKDSVHYRAARPAAYGAVKDVTTSPGLHSPLALPAVRKSEASTSESGSETTSEHGEQEVRMSLQQLHSVCEAATKLKGHVKKETLVPAWVQSLLTVAHENLEHIEGYFEGKHMKKSTTPPPVGAMSPVRAHGTGSQKPKQGTSMKKTNRAVGAPGIASPDTVKSDAPAIPSFPRVTGNSRVLLQHITPDQTVINQITSRDTHQPHSYGLAPSNWEENNGLRRR